MKKLIILALTAVLALAAAGATYTLTWEASPGATGYKIYSSTNGVNFKLERSTANLTVTLSNVPLSVVTFGVSATNAVAESSKATADILFPPGNVRIITVEP
jgi:hypothetical protein